MSEPKSIHELGEMVGIPRKTTDEIIAEVRANQSLLQSCKTPHDFSICVDRRTRQPIEHPKPSQVFGAKWRCSKCGGTISATDRHWYNLGLKHAGG